MSHSTPKVWYMAQGCPVAGGHEAHILHYATVLRKQGFDVEVVVPDRLPREEHRFLRGLRVRGIPVTSIEANCAGVIAVKGCVLGIPWSMANRLRGRKVPRSAYRRHIAGKQVAAVLRRKIANEHPDVIHVLGRLADNLWDVLPAERTVFHHGTEGVCDASWNDDEAEHFRVFCERAARNFAPGSGVAANVKKHFRIQRKIDTIFTICPDEVCDSAQTGDAASGEMNHGLHEYHGSQTSDLGTPTSGLRFGILCRFISEKGIEDILEALELYIEKHGAVDFVFAGQGPLEGLIRQVMERLETGDRRPETPAPGEVLSEMSAVSSLPSPVAPTIRIERVTSPVETLREFDVFVHPSRSDAMPMAVAEALMCGKPCVVSRAGGLPDLVRDGVEGILVGAGRPAQIVAAMERFAAMNLQELTAFGRRARQRYEEKCLPEKVGDIVAQHYRQIIRARDG